ncbi:transposase, partial [bacterium]|nr:transposase [bacterium]
KDLGRIIGAFKTITTKGINQLYGISGQKIWQRNFYERIIRDNSELDSVRKYIQDNPMKWLDDPENPANISLPSSGN